MIITLKNLKPSTPSDILLDEFLTPTPPNTCPTCGCFLKSSYKSDGPDSYHREYQCMGNSEHNWSE